MNTSISVFSYQNEVLPIWATLEEKNIEQMIYRSIHNPTSTEILLRNSSNIRVPAEFEEVSAILLTYKKGLVDNMKFLLDNISISVSEAGAEVWAIGGPIFGISGVPLEMYKNIDIISNSFWIRDYGPIPFYMNEDFGLIDTVYRRYITRKYDDMIPCELAKMMNVTCFDTTLIMDGGNVMVDGIGNLFMTNITYKWNVEMDKEEVDNELRNIFGVKNIHTFEYGLATPSHPYYKPEGHYPADGTGHIDMFAKIVAPCRVIVAMSYDEIMKEVLEKAANYFSKLLCHESHSTFYEVFRIRSWFDHEKFVWYTYTNSLIVNNVVIIPSYDEGDNEAAIEVYKHSMPDKKIVSINTDVSILHGGSIHCLTRQIPKM